MSISKYVAITVKGNKSSTSEKPLFIYQGDFGIDFYFTINQFNYDIKANTTVGTRNIVGDLPQGAYSATLIKRPNGSIFTEEPFSITTDGFIKFSITKDFTDELDDIGEYLIQFHLYDGNEEDSNRITIPPITFEVKPLLE